ncbi:AAA family ATPase [Bacteroides fragilis]|nr:AAA family ATPase [Bacteroides fragilis]
MRIIGVQILPGTDITIRKSLNIGWYPLIKCKNDIASDDKLIPIIAEDCCPQSYYKIDKRLPFISVCAIVGENGSGKSSLLEIIYRIINNFAATLLPSPQLNNNKNVTVLYATGLEARLFFELKGEIRCIYNHDIVTNYFTVIKGNCKELKISNLTSDERNVVLQNFFYTIALNYSLYALNSSDYDPIIPKENEQKGAGEWLKNMFHKNDGYYIPIALTPYRDDGEININNENNLALQRLSVFSLLFHSQRKSFIEGYAPDELQYQYIKDYKSIKIEGFRSRLSYTYPELITSIDILIKHFELAWEKKILEELGIDLNDDSNDRNETIAFFLAYKSTKICLTYPSFQKMLNLNGILRLKQTTSEPENKRTEKIPTQALSYWLKANTDKINAITNELYKEKNHITIKIHQCINYLTNQRYKEDGVYSISYKDLMGTKRYKTYDEVLVLLPPPFFKIDLKLRKKTRGQKEETKTKPEAITLQTMSSGERQLLYSMSYIFYHIKNIASIQEDDERICYNHINLIFDEAELYYHPEFQRIFVRRLLENLAICHIDRRIIRSINIIIVTHSPFLLSDIPETNILFLGDEEQQGKQKTLGANIYDLLKSSFFMKYAIGDFAQHKLNELMEVYYNKKDSKNRQDIFLEKYDEFKFTAEHIADDYLSKTFLFMFHEMQQEFKPEDARSRIEKELQDMELKVEKLRKTLRK